MKVLYLSGYHPVLEYDECILLEELGADWFSTGIYLDPEKPLPFPHLNLRKPIYKSDISLVEHRCQSFLKDNPGYKGNFSGMNRPRTVLTKEFVKEYDVIFAPNSTAIVENWEVIKDKPIIWRTVGAINADLERKLKPYVAKGNVYPVRFSPIEMLHPESNGGTYIRNYVDENVYKEWKPDSSNTVLSFQSWFAQRRHLRINQAYLLLRNKVPAVHFQLFGAFIGMGDPLNLGTPTWSRQVEMYQKSLAYFYIGSPVAIPAYNYLEAMMTGCPVITFGPKIAGLPSPVDSSLLHEPSEFINNGTNGFYSDDLDEIAQMLTQLRREPRTAKAMGEEGRKTALKLFSKEKALKEWEDFFKDKLGVF